MHGRRLPCLEGSANVRQQAGGTAEISAENTDLQLLIFEQNSQQFGVVSSLYILLEKNPPPFTPSVSDFLWI